MARHKETDSEGRRWYDSARIVWALLGTIAMMVVAWGSVVYGTARASEIKNAEQDIEMRAINERIIRIEGGVHRTEDKLDKVLEQRR